MPDSFNLEEAKNLSEELNQQLQSLSEQEKRVISMKFGVQDISSAFDEMSTRLFNQRNLFTQNKQILSQWSEEIDEAKSSFAKVQEQAQAGADLMAKPLNAFVSTIESLPGGEFLVKKMGLPEAIESIQSGITESLSEGFATGRLQASHVNKAIESIQTNITGLIGPWTIFLALLAVSLNRFFEIDQITRQIRDETGFVGENLEMMVDSSRSINIQFQELGVSLEDAAKITTAIVNEFGSLVFLTDQNQEAVARLVGGLKVSAEQAASLVGVFTDITGSTGQIRDNAIATTIQLAKANDVAPKAVLDDIAKSSGKIFEFTDGTAATIAQTAVDARRLGISLDAVAGISENLLDFESSIEATMNAMVLTGRNLNLEQARYFALTGETDKLLQEITNQLGSYQELQSLLPFQQKALADAIGVSVAELRRMTKTQEILTELAEGTKTSYEAIQEGARLSDVLDARGVLTPLEQLQNSLKSILVSISEILIPALQILNPALRVLADILNGVATLIGGLNEITDGWGGRLIGLTAGVLGLVKAFKSFQAVSLAFMASNPLGWVIGAISLIALLATHWEEVSSFFVKVWSDTVGRIKNEIQILIDAAMSIKDIFVSIFQFLFGNTIWSADTIKAVFEPIAAVIETIFGTIGQIIQAAFTGAMGVIQSIGDTLSVVLAPLNKMLDLALDFIGGGPAGAEVQVRGTAAGAPEAVQLAGAGGGEVTIEGQEISMVDVVERLDTLIEILSKSKDIKMDGRKVGEQIAVASPKL